MEKLTFFTALLLISGCGTPRETPATAKIIYYHVALDLSDRLLRQGQAERDLVAINTVITEFGERASFNDQLHLHVILQPDVPDYSSSDDLVINLAKIPLRDMREEITRKLDKLRSVVKNIYDEATQREGFSGADTWRYFRDLYLPKTTLSGDTIHHVVILLTDGYTTSKGRNFQTEEGSTFIPQSVLDDMRECNEGPASFQMLPARTDLHHVSILVLEIRPRVDEICEFSALQSIWDDWIRSMNTGNSEIHRSRSGTWATSDIINKFLIKIRSSK